MEYVELHRHERYGAFLLYYSGCSLYSMLFALVRLSLVNPVCSVSVRERKSSVYLCESDLCIRFFFAFVLISCWSSFLVLSFSTEI